MNDLLNELKEKKLVSYASPGVDSKHLLAANSAARGSFYPTRVGFVAVGRTGIRIARSHNGFAPRVDENLARWNRQEKDFYHMHAECVGVFNAAKNGYATEGAAAYITHPPCPGCMQGLIAAGFARIVFDERMLIDRPDWREDFEKSFTLARENGVQIVLYSDNHSTEPDADIARTERKVKDLSNKLLDQHPPGDSHPPISAANKPDSPEWSEHPAIKHLFACARHGLKLDGAGVVLDFKPECRVTTALVQCGVSHIILLNNAPDRADPRWGNEYEITRAEMILSEVGIPIDHASSSKPVLGLLNKSPAYLDATREGLKIASKAIIRPPSLPSSSSAPSKHLCL